MLKLSFFTDQKGHVAYMILHQNGRDTNGVKR